MGKWEIKVIMNDKIQSNDEWRIELMETHFQRFHARQSPFHKEYKDKTEKIDVRLSVQAQKDLKKHFEGLYGNKKGAFSKGIQSICHDYLDKLCFERKIFEHLEVIMLIPKTDNIKALEVKSHIIAFINHDIDFEEYYISSHRKGEDYLTYDLMDFKEENFPMNLLKETEDSAVIFTPKEELNMFSNFKRRQGQLYQELDIDDCYFVRFPLNNYLDKNLNGQFHHHTFKGNHIGLILLEDIIADRKLFMIVDWFYESEFSNRIVIDYQFADGDELLNWIKNSYDDEDSAIVRAAFQRFYDNEYRQSRLKILEDDLMKKLAIVKSLQNDESED